jgi:hypothetical protein
MNIGNSSKLLHDINLIFKPVVTLQIKLTSIHLQAFVSQL